jgi:hypothetical protein
MTKAPMDTLQLSCIQIAIALLLFTQVKSTTKETFTLIQTVRSPAVLLVRDLPFSHSGQVCQTLPTSFHHGRVMTAADGRASIAAIEPAMLSGSISKALIAEAAMGVCKY